MYVIHSFCIKNLNFIHYLIFDNILYNFTVSNK